MAFHHSLPVAYVTAELSNQIFMLQFGADNTATALAFWETAQRREGVVLTAHLQLSRRYGMLYACPGTYACSGLIQAGMWPQPPCSASARPARRR